MERMRKYMEEGKGVKRASIGPPNQLEAQNNSSSSPHYDLGAAHIDLDGQVAYGLHFRCFIYGWKA